MCKKTNTDFVPDGQNLIFDQVIVEEGVAYTPGTGEILLPDEGMYIVDWNVVTQSATGTTSVSFKLVSSAGAEFLSNMPSKTGNLTGIATLQAEPMTQLSLVNSSNGPVYFSGSMAVKASLRIFKLDLPTDDARCFALEQFGFVLDQLVQL